MLALHHEYYESEYYITYTPCDSLKNPSICMYLHYVLQLENKLMRYFPPIKLCLYNSIVDSESDFISLVFEITESIFTSPKVLVENTDGDDMMVGD